MSGAEKLPVESIGSPPSPSNSTALIFFYDGTLAVPGTKTPRSPDTGKFLSDLKQAGATLFLVHPRKIGADTIAGLDNPAGYTDFNQIPTEIRRQQERLVLQNTISDLSSAGIEPGLFECIKPAIILDKPSLAPDAIHQANAHAIDALMLNRRLVKDTVLVVGSSNLHEGEAANTVGVQFLHIQDARTAKRPGEGTEYRDTKPLRDYPRLASLLPSDTQQNHQEPIKQ